MILCPRCQKRNPDGVASCQFCGSAMIGAAPAGGRPGTPGATYKPPLGGPSRTSRMAGASLGLGILGLLTAGLTALIGLILGIVGLRQIDGSGGTIQGRGTAVAGIVVSALVLTMMFFLIPIMAAILFPIFAQAREQARAAGCMSNMRQVGLATMMYAQDYDGRLPRANNWCDGVFPYLRTPSGRSPRSMFYCPSLGTGTGGQAYNSRLSTVSLDRIPTPGATVLAFDGTGGWNLAGGPELGVPRHRDGLYVLFSNGAVKWTQSLNSMVWKPAPPVVSTTRRGKGRRRGRR